MHRKLLAWAAGFGFFVYLLIVTGLGLAALNVGTPPNVASRAAIAGAVFWCGLAGSSLGLLVSPLVVHHFTRAQSLAYAIMISSALLFLHAIGVGVVTALVTGNWRSMFVVVPAATLVATIFSLPMFGFSLWCRRRYSGHVSDAVIERDAPE